LERLEVFWRVEAPSSGRVYECVLYATDAASSFGCSAMKMMC
jgi:hypothetical protein